jgi:hypothetical protein
MLWSLSESFTSGLYAGTGLNIASSNIVSYNFRMYVAELDTSDVFQTNV